MSFLLALLLGMVVWYIIKGRHSGITRTQTRQRIL